MMLSVFSFARHVTSVKYTRCDAFPFKLFAAKSTVIELDFKGGKMTVESSQKIRVNNIETCFARVKPYDVITHDSHLFILVHDCPYGNQLFYSGRIQYKDAAARLFLAPSRVYAGFFTQLSHMISNYPEVGQVIIDCQAITYMDSESVAAMLGLIHLARRNKCAIRIYAPSHKFNSYVTLANITKLISEIPHVPSVRAAMDGTRRDTAHILFAFQNQDHLYGMRPDRITYIGRSVDFCDMSIDNSSVSRVHAAIMIIRNCLYLIDFGSTNGTFVNEKQVAPFTLRMVKINDRLFFGNTPPFKMVLN